MDRSEGGTPPCRQEMPGAAGTAECARRLDRAISHLRVMLDSVRHGLMMFAPDGTVQVCNRRALDLLGLPPGLIEGRFSVADIETSLAEVTVEPAGDPRTTTLTRPDGQVIEIHADPLAAGGVVMVIEDVTAERRREAELRLAEAEYRGLFENAICGIYRDRIDGTPIRANTALVNLNGYATEAEYLEAIGGAPANWYVEPGRAEEFHRLMRTEGRVDDFVSEVYRHKTRERIWITENAWYVRDASGVPIYIEGTIQDATERVRGLAAIERQLNTDALTGAASRFHFMNTLHALTRDAASVFVLFTIDLDHFKDVNDNLGHGAGDTLLKAVASRLREIAGPAATVGRLGGDEFAVVIPGRGAAVSADLKARQIVNALRLPIEIGGHNATVGASVGVACYPAQASDANELLTHADLALYQVKSNGRNGFRVFDQGMKTTLNQRKGLAGSSATRSSRRNSNSSISRSCARDRERWWAMRRCCAGAIPEGDFWRRATSSKSPRRLG